MNNVIEKITHILNTLSAEYNQQAAIDSSSYFTTWVQHTMFFK